jgi:hypothetical protein
LAVMGIYVRHFDAYVLVNKFSANHSGDYDLLELCRVMFLIYHPIFVLKTIMCPVSSVAGGDDTTWPQGCQIILGKHNPNLKKCTI